MLRSAACAELMTENLPIHACVDFYMDQASSSESEESEVSSKALCQRRHVKRPIQRRGLGATI